ncbi:MAG TPA: hypothetical protein VGU22_00625 [Methylomirabilota bacterium]|nr:hypothetical protein [Methylomirabilota bacterium]
MLGEFSDMRFTAEHQYGETVQLYREAGAVFGLFMHAAGLAGDTPMGLLEDVRFDPTTGTLSFSARLTMGVQYAPTGNVPSRDLFRFDGRLRGDTLTGTLARKDMLNETVPAESRQVTLKRTKETLDPPASYTAWRRSVDGILLLRGPKW